MLDLTSSCWKCGKLNDKPPVGKALDPTLGVIKLGMVYSSCFATLSCTIHEVGLGLDNTHDVQYQKYRTGISPLVTMMVYCYC